ncbi:hypothetical protein SAMN05443287_106192 [Micromonospora phaseoli]|uniref:SprT-like family protein n=1 Tax=Micromonospora phaseoli TaxID=1144548 RepID=A0A1H7AKY3_9ACTN|nr:hypothetical protein [Micromonospora phaseoli]PZV96318.1 hypothetical protein CLV64_107196 [Micromonospora phaseoli]GIJ76003.1 hypothetical protein Xph01_04350 [Micromonospora phaseoli]SEJ66028.1 hypothetical protein SAMN05443287_106192 [Micromonospora phaseoli]
MNEPSAKEVTLQEVMPDLLALAWERLNRLAFNGEMRMPTIEVVPGKESSYTWNNNGSPGTIRIGAAVADGDYTQALGSSAHVLLHEMAHQYVAEVKGKYHAGDGPVFQRELQAAYERLKGVQQ